MTGVGPSQGRTVGRYLFGGARHQALVQSQRLLLREALGLVVPHQGALDLRGRGGVNTNRDLTKVP